MAIGVCVCAWESKNFWCQIYFVCFFIAHGNMGGNASTVRCPWIVAPVKQSTSVCDVHVTTCLRETHTLILALVISIIVDHHKMPLCWYEDRQQSTLAFRFSHSDICCVYTVYFRLYTHVVAWIIPKLYIYIYILFLLCIHSALCTLHYTILHIWHENEMTKVK